MRYSNTLYCHISYGKQYFSYLATKYLSMVLQNSMVLDRGVEVSNSIWTLNWLREECTKYQIVYHKHKTNDYSC